MQTLEGWTRVHETDVHEVWMHKDGWISRRTHDPWKGTWAWTTEKALPRCDDDGNSSVQLGPRVLRLDKAFSLSDGGTRPLPRRLLKLETTLHEKRAHSLDKLMVHVRIQRGTVLAYMLQLVRERPYGETTRLAARLVPDELMRQLCRVDPGALCGRLQPLMHTLDRTMGSAWRADPHKYALLRLARECLRKRKARQRINPSERGVISA